MAYYSIYTTDLITFIQKELASLRHVIKQVMDITAVVNATDEELHVWRTTMDIVSGSGENEVIYKLLNQRLSAVIRDNESTAA